MEKMLEMRFSAGVILAVNCVLRILGGSFWFIPNKWPVAFEELDPLGRKKAAVPVWCNFAISFFSKIKATPIELRACDGDGSRWNMERNVLFFYRDEIVAVVTILGCGYDEEATWVIGKVRYRLYADGAVPKDHPDAGRWVELELIPSIIAFIESK